MRAIGILSPVHVAQHGHAYASLSAKKRRPRPRHLRLWQQNRNTCWALHVITLAALRAACHCRIPLLTTKRSHYRSLRPQKSRSGRAGQLPWKGTSTAMAQAAACLTRRTHQSRIRNRRPPQVCVRTPVYCYTVSCSSAAECHTCCISLVLAAADVVLLGLMSQLVRDASMQIDGARNSPGSKYMNLLCDIIELISSCMEPVDECKPNTGIRADSSQHLARFASSSMHDCNGSMQQVAQYPVRFVSAATE
jgi:hypothetical protein